MKKKTTIFGQEQTPVPLRHYRLENRELTLTIIAESAILSKSSACVFFLFTNPFHLLFIYKATCSRKLKTMERNCHVYATENSNALFEENFQQKF